jgi:peptidoglycan/LPS O-acetylase OafA/YrhL
VKLIDREWVSRAPKLARAAPFDGIRGIGVIGVMIGHSFGQDTLSFSAIVDIFFVISGFLITTLLLQEHRSTGRVDVRKFYARRSLRLLPLLYVVLVVNGVLALAAKAAGMLDGTQYTISGLVKETGAAGTYVYNVVYSIPNGAWLSHLWTLSVEEQFYLLVGVTMLVVLVRGGIGAFTWLLAGLIVAIQLSRLFLWVGPFGKVAVAVWAQRPDSLMVGMLAALVSARVPAPVSPRFRRTVGTLALAGIAGIFFAVWSGTHWLHDVLGWSVPYSPSADEINRFLDTGAWRYHGGGHYWIQWGNSLGAWSFFFITLAAFRMDDWWPNRYISWKPIVWIGGCLSYGLYVWHYVVNHFLRITIGTDPSDPLHERVAAPWWVQLGLDVLVPFAIAIPSYYWVERRALRLKDRFQVEKVAPAGLSSPR